MTVENNSAIAIDTLSDWLKNSSRNEKQNHVRVIFDALWASYVLLQGIQIGPPRCLLLSWLAGVIILILVLQQSFEYRSIWLSFTLCAQKNDCYLLEITFRGMSWFLVFASRSQRQRTASRLIQWFTVISLALFSRNEGFVEQNSYARAHRRKEDKEKGQQLLVSFAAVFRDVTQLFRGIVAWHPERRLRRRLSSSRTTPNDIYEDQSFRSLSRIRKGRGWRWRVKDKLNNPSRNLHLVTREVARSKS